MGSLMGLDTVRRTPPSVQRPVSRKWMPGLMFLAMPGVSWNGAVAPITAPTTVGTYGFGNYGRDWTPAGNTGACLGKTVAACGNNYTIFSVQRCGSGAVQNPIDDDYISGAGTRYFQFRINASNQVEFIPFNTAGSAFTVTGATVSAADRLCGFPMAATQASAGASAVWYRGSKKTGTTTGTPQSVSNPWIGASRNNSQQMLGGIAVAGMWSYVMTDDQIRSLMANPMQLLD